MIYCKKGKKVIAYFISTNTFLQIIQVFINIMENQYD